MKPLSLTRLQQNQSRCTQMLIRKVAFSLRKSHLAPSLSRRRYSVSALPAAAAFLAATFAATAFAQTPAPQPPAGAPQHHEAPAPTNLKVLPPNLTGEQVHEIMHKWAADLGTECSTCHAADPAHLGPDGRPRLNFALDTKPEKNTARVMFTMMQEINSQYIAKIDSSGEPVTCGTCHRGHVDPAPFVPPPDHDHDHDHHEAPAAAPPPASR